MSFRKETQQKEAQMEQRARECYSWLEPRLASSHVPLYFEAAALVVSAVADQIRRKAIDICGLLGAQDAGIDGVKLNESPLSILHTHARRTVGITPGKNTFHEAADQVETLLAGTDRQKSLEVLANWYKDPHPPVFIVLPRHLRSTE